MARGRVDGELVVAIGDDDHGPGVLDPAGQQAQDVDRRRIGPMGVLQDRDRGRPRAQRAEHRLGEGEGVLARRRRRVGRDELAQRRQRHGHRQRLAGPDQEGRPRSEPLAQRAHQRCLADARLAGHEDELAAPVARRLHDRLQRRQLLAAFQQRIHAAILIAVRRADHLTPRSTRRAGRSAGRPPAPGRP
jgi:hypothetical protein